MKSCEIASLTPNKDTHENYVNSQFSRDCSYSFFSFFSAQHIGRRPDFLNWKIGNIFLQFVSVHYKLWRNFWRNFENRIISKITPGYRIWNMDIIPGMIFLKNILGRFMHMHRSGLYDFCSLLLLTWRLMQKIETLMNIAQRTFVVDMTNQGFFASVSTS